MEVGRRGAKCRRPPRLERFDPPRLAGEESESVLRTPRTHFGAGENAHRVRVQSVVLRPAHELSRVCGCALEISTGEFCLSGPELVGESEIGVRCHVGRSSFLQS